jgi:hypothetical protein
MLPRVCFPLFVFLLFGGVVPLLPVLAQEVGSDAPSIPLPPASTDWKQWVAYVLVLVVTVFLLPFLKQRAAAAQAEAEKLRSEASNLDLQSKAVVLRELEAFLFSTAAVIAEKNFHRLASKIVNKEMTSKAEVKAELASWGAELKRLAIEHFQRQGVDVLTMVGDEYLDRAIAYAADRVSPFPGLETAKFLLQEHVSNAVVKYGVEWVRRRLLAEGDLTPPAPAPTPTPNA